MQPYIGFYQAHLSDVAVTSEGAGAGGGLVLQVIPKGGFPDKNSPPGPKPPPAPAAFYAQDNILITEGPSREGKGEFIRNEQGEIVWLRFGGRLHRRQ